jgi:hypothetical protein
MLIVVPVSESDSNLIEDFSKCFNKFGPYVNHKILIVARPSDARYAVEVFQNIKKSCKTIDLYIFDSDGTRGWPQGPNHYWKQTILALKYKFKNNLPWLWMEMDMTPVKENWIDSIEMEYKNCGKKCLGWIENTTTLTRGNKIIPISKHLVGAAVYPPDIDRVCKLWQSVDDIDIAFDVVCQWELVPISHHTTLFQHGFRTKNYKEYSIGYIKGEDDNNFPDGLRFDLPIDNKTVLHHGCIDGSLSRLLIDIYE